MEIERKWKISGFPDHLPLLDTFQMRQSYLSTCPVVRVRESISTKKHTFILCFKGHGTLVREEIELPLEESIFRRLEALTGHPPITKELRLYALSGGLQLEVSCVDKGLPTEFYYAEVEFDSVESANAFSPLPDIRPRGRNDRKRGLFHEPLLAVYAPQSNPLHALRGGFDKRGHAVQNTAFVGASAAGQQFSFSLESRRFYFSAPHIGRNHTERAALSRVRTHHAFSSV